MVSIGMLILFVQYKTGKWSWWSTFFFFFFDRKLVVNFLDLIYSVLVRGNGMDQLCWKPSASGVFNYTDNLQKRIVVVLDWCCMCKKDGESIDHLLLHCHVARELWNMVFSLFGVHWVMPCHVVDLLASWLYKCSRRKSLVIWSMTPHCIMWGIWRERNARTFEGCERSTHDMKLFFLQTLLEWTDALGVFTFYSLTVC